MSVLEQAIGWISPPECIACGLEGDVLCISCLTTEIVPAARRCWRCSALSSRAVACQSCRHAGGPRTVWITSDYQGVVQQLIGLYKFGQLRATADCMTALMVKTIRDSIPEQTIQAQQYLIVPVPTATSRVRHRGFDHTALLAKLIAKKLKAEYYPALGRIGQSRQVGATREDRLKQVADNYFVKNSKMIKNRNVLVVDDVITTGGTIISVTKKLRESGAKHIDALVLAKKL